VSFVGTLTINIRDVNDEPPQFTQTVYKATVPEAATIGTNVITVKATDIDIDTSITYNITDERSSILNAFKIDSETGIYRDQNIWSAIVHKTSMKGGVHSNAKNPIWSAHATIYFKI